MSTYKIAVFVGSLRAASINLRLARALEKLVPADFKFDYVSLGDVPLYNQDNAVSYTHLTLPTNREV